MKTSCKIKNDIKKLQEEKNLLLEQIRQYDILIKEKQALYNNLYAEFFYKKSTKDFILYEDFPSFDEIKAYYNEERRIHPISSFGNFNIKELAQVIKLLYSFERQKEYQIFTFGNLSLDHTGPEDIDRELKPYLYFLIGDEENLDPYKEFNHTFSEQEYHYPFEKSKIQNLICLQPNKGDFQNTLEIISDYPYHFIKNGSNYNKNGINYYDDLNKIPTCQTFAINTNIFSNYLPIIYQGIQDTLNFPIYIDDRFIAQTLISIAIYKKNMGKFELSNEDYCYIFHELYGEDIDLKKEIEKDIPKTLKYYKKIY